MTEAGDTTLDSWEEFDDKPSAVRAAQALDTTPDSWEEIENTPKSQNATREVDWNAVNSWDQFEETAEKKIYASGDSSHGLKKGTRNVKLQKRKVTLWSYYFEGNVEIEEICIHSLTQQCPDEKTYCKRLHAKKKWHWQLQKGNSWHNFLWTQSDRLERAYLNVEKDEVVLRSLDLSRTGKLGANLFLLLGNDQWRANFTQMIIRNERNGNVFKIRRLATPSIEKFKSNNATEYRWFCQDNEGWIELGKFLEDMQKQASRSHPKKSVMSSSEVEKQYKKNNQACIDIKLTDRKFKLNLSKMELADLNTKEVFRVRRRPRNDNVVFPTVWSYNAFGDVEVPEICMNTIDRKCAIPEGCGRLHSDKEWHWQFGYDGLWFNFPKVQNKALEDRKGKIPGICLEKTGNIGKILSKYLGTTIWHPDFKTMTIRKDKSDVTLAIRRLSVSHSSSPSVVQVDVLKYVWHYRNDEGRWVEFGCDPAFEKSGRNCELTSSDIIEKEYLSLSEEDIFSVYTPDGAFELSFENMKMVNTATGQVIAVSRRLADSKISPVNEEASAESDGIPQPKHDIPVIFDMNPKDQQIIKSSILKKLSLENLTIKKINNHTLRNGFEREHKNAQNVLTLFHWVAKDKVDEVCRTNLQHEHQCPEIRAALSDFEVILNISPKYNHQSCSYSRSVRDHKLVVFKAFVGDAVDQKDEDADSSTRVDNVSCPTRYMMSYIHDYFPEYLVSI